MSTTDRLATPRPANRAARHAKADIAQDELRKADCMHALRAIRKGDNFDGAFRLLRACEVCIEHDLSDADAMELIGGYALLQPFPREYDETEVLKFVRRAEGRTIRGAAYLPKAPEQPAAEPSRYAPQYRSVEQLVMQFPHLRKPLIEGLLREGETMNVIAPPKTGKSWLVTDLAIAVATGQPWLGSFHTHRGNVLIIDNELHGETSAHRIPKVAEARRIGLEEISRTVYVENLRGRLRDLTEMGAYFKEIGARRFKLIVLDAFYRFIPKDTDENDNGSVARLYNYLDHFAMELQCSFVLIHHSTKGTQAYKAITDVGAGAGSQSRATDTHLILRRHEEEDTVVLEAAVRSWPRLEPLCLCWSFPVWNPDDSLDPTLLQGNRSRRRKAEKEPAKPPEPPWDAARFVREFITEEARTRAAILEQAEKAGLSERRAEKLLRRAEEMKHAYRWQFASNEPVKYATVQQPLLDVKPEKKAKKRRRK